MTSARTTVAWRIVARREIVTKLTDKAFLIGTAVTIALIAGFMGVTAYLDARTSTSTVAVTPADADFARTLAPAVTAVDDTVKVTVLDVPDAAAAKAHLLDGTADAWLHQDGDTWVLTGKNAVDGSLLAAMGTALRVHVVAVNAAQAGTSSAAIEHGATLTSGLLIGNAEQQGFAKGVGFALALLFYMSSITFGMTLAGSVVEEKSSRIVEIITTKIPVRQLLIGKVAGNSALALGQMALFTGLGLAGLTMTPYKKYVPSVSGGIAWFVVFFVVGFLLIACLWAVAGALASRSEDLQQTATPITMGLVLMWFSVLLAKGSALVALSFVPPFSAILMPIRLVQGTASWWEPIIALVLLLACAALIVRGADRLYRRALLQTQGRLSLRQAWHAAE